MHARLRSLAAACSLLMPLGVGSPAGAVSSGTSPDPVIIVSGFTAAASTGEPMAIRIRAATGAKVYTTVGSRNSATGSIAQGAQDLALLVDQVLAETGATKVDLVGYSMGGLTARQYVRFEGGNGKVDTLVTVHTPNHGTNRADLANILDCAGIPACDDMVTTSDFLRTLNAEDETWGSPKYYTFRTLWDQVVVPIDSVMLAGATNTLMQAQCPLRYVDHLTGPFDGATADGVIDALAGRSIAMNCFAI